MPKARLYDSRKSENNFGDNDVARIAAARDSLHSNNNPLWVGPCGAGPLGGITQSMLVRFLSCRERFRLRYIVGMETHDKWNKNLGFGNMWHVCEEALAGKGAWPVALDAHCYEMLQQYPMQREEIVKWGSVCQVMFPEYIRYWAEHSDVKNRTPIFQEKVFDVPYLLPSGRVVRLRGKFDSVDLIDGIWLQENKTKGDIDKQQVERQLSFDLQTMTYLIALKEEQDRSLNAFANFVKHPIKGVRYNVIKRPLSGGRGSIKPHAAKHTRTRVTPAETDDEFYERLRRDYISAEPDYWFFRVKVEITARDIQIFRETCLDPLLETLCWWYDTVCSPTPTITAKHCGTILPMNYRTPFGIWSALEEGGATEYDTYLEMGSEAGLRRVQTLFSELQ